MVGVLLLLALNLPVPASNETVVRRAHAYRLELAGWLRGTGPCAAGRVGRRLAELLREGGVTAEFHRAGEEGGYTVARIGPEHAETSAVLVAELVGCPEAPDSRELEHGAAARGVWRAAALAAALEEVGRRKPSWRYNLQVLFLCGDGSGRCGRAFVGNTLPTLVEHNLLIESVPYAVEGNQWPVVNSYKVEVDLFFRALPGPDPGTRIDRVLMLAENLAVWPHQAMGISCQQPQRRDLASGSIRCILPQDRTVSDLAFDLYHKMKKPTVTIYYESNKSARLQIDRTLRATRSALQKNRPAAELVTRPDPSQFFCGGLTPPRNTNIGLPLFSDNGSGELIAFEQGSILAVDLLTELATGGTPVEQLE